MAAARGALAEAAAVNTNPSDGFPLGLTPAETAARVKVSVKADDG
jgi:hypothetical protein